mgnify:CR=1 FL=1
MIDTPNTAPRLFERSLVRQHRERAASRFATFDFLFQEVAERLNERLDDIRRSFATVLDLGSHQGNLGRLLQNRPGVETLVSCDLAPALVAHAPGLRLAADEEWLPFAEARFDLLVSNLSLHWVNDLPGALIQARRTLKADGFFLAALLGGNTLTELRQCLMEAEVAVCGGAAPRVSPFADLQDAGRLLQRAGFALPVADADTLTVTFRDLFHLMQELRAMGESTALVQRSRRPLPRTVFLEAARLYQRHFAEPDGRLPATFEILYLTGWAPHPDQPKPLAPGSATMTLAQGLESRRRNGAA